MKLLDRCLPRRRHVCVVHVCVLFGLLISGVGRADTVLYSTGFEPPTFSVGPISGQGGWLAACPPSPPVCVTPALRSLPQIENTVVESGTQAFAIPANTPGLTNTGAYYVLTPRAPGLIDMSADIQISGAGTPEYQFGALGGAGVPGVDGFIGGIQITGQNILALTAAGGDFVPIGGGFTPDVWHHVDVEFNFSTQNFSVLLDGVLLDSDIPFCGGVLSCSGTLVIPAFASGFFDAFMASPSTGYMDNFEVATVPEPSSSLMLVSGLVGIFLARCGSKWRSRDQA